MRDSKEKVATHVLVCWNHWYEPHTIERHKEIISEEGFVWWGKFKEERFRNYETELEIFEGPLDEEDKATFASRINKQIHTGLETHLYVCNPDPVRFSLHVGHLTKVAFTDGGPPPGTDSCRYVPAYYYKDGNKNPENFRFACSFWFKITDNLLTLDAEYVWKLTDLSEHDRPHQLTFSIPNFYPMAVKTSENKLFFASEAGDAEQPSEIYKEPSEVSNLSSRKRMGSLGDHHLPKGAKNFIGSLSRCPWVYGFRYLNGFPATRLEGTDITGHTEIDSDGGITYVYSSDWSIKFKILTTAETRAEGQWVADRLFSRAKPARGFEA